MSPHDNLYTVEPADAVEMYLDHRRSDVTDTTLQAHRIRLGHFVRWCEANGIDNMNEITGRDLYEFRLWRENEGDLKTVSLKTQLSTLRVFIKFCEDIEAVPSGTHERIPMPTLSEGEEVDDVSISAEEAEQLLEYLSKFEYASAKHLIAQILWETGMRLGALHSLDVDDVLFEKHALALEHRPETGTTLKNGLQGERVVAISSETTEIIEDYIDVTRPDVTDDYDRHPLVATENGRMQKNHIRTKIYAMTRPCFYTDECPHGREPSYDGCEAYYISKSMKCPSSVHPHAFRRGAITDHLLDDVPKQVVSDRMNVSPDVLEEHYDIRSEQEKMSQRRRSLDLDG